MNFKIQKVRVSIDHLTMTSDDRRKIKFDPAVLSRYKYLGKRRTVKNPSDDEDYFPGYAFFHKFGRQTGRKVHIFCSGDNPPDRFYVPNLVVKFYPHWESPLSYREVVSVLNELIEKYGVNFSVSQFHVAVDLFSERDRQTIYRLAGRSKSRRTINPKELFPRTFYFQSQRAPFRQILYDKRRALLKKRKKEGHELSSQAIRAIKQHEISRFESRVNNTSLRWVPSLPTLANMDFRFLVPQHLAFLKPQEERVVQHGLSPKVFRNWSLIELRRKLKAKGITNNFFYYTEPDERLGGPVLRALGRFRWCDNPDKYQFLLPEFRIRPQGIEFVRIPHPKTR
jgi:hypothetical protein